MAAAGTRKIRQLQGALVVQVYRLSRRPL